MMKIIALAGAADQQVEKAIIVSARVFFLQPLVEFQNLRVNAQMVAIVKNMQLVA